MQRPYSYTGESQSINQCRRNLCLDKEIKSEDFCQQSQCFHSLGILPVVPSGTKVLQQRPEHWTDLVIAINPFPGRISFHIGIPCFKSLINSYKQLLLRKKLYFAYPRAFYVKKSVIWFQPLQWSKGRVLKSMFPPGLKALLKPWAQSGWSSSGKLKFQRKYMQEAKKPRFCFSVENTDILL